jgi:hypothetical protein
MKLTKDHPLFESFLHLCCRLSPENITCDGECSHAEVKQRYAQIEREWRVLEKKAGFSVTENDVWRAEGVIA